MSQRKKTTIKHSVLSDVMSHLSKLPEREKDPGTPVSLSEIFRTKEYAAEISSALKRGYSFEDLAGIFTERCGVDITARQLKYHYTRERNLKAKSRKSKGEAASKDNVPPVDAPPTYNTEAEVFQAEKHRLNT